jgi:hypothetical protein
MFSLLLYGNRVTIRAGRLIDVVHMLAVSLPSLTAQALGHVARIPSNSLHPVGFDQ